MRIRCVHNTGADIRPYEYDALEPSQFGRFGASEKTNYGQIEIGKEYQVMGMILFKSYLSYLVDDQGFVSVLPCQLFNVVDGRIHRDWEFRLIGNHEDIYPLVQAIWGYPELCSDVRSYEKLIEQDEEALTLYFKRKMEFEQE